MNGDVWVWVPREQDGTIGEGLVDLLREGGALARRLGGALSAVCDREPEPGLLDRLGDWGVKSLRVLGRPLAPHPKMIGGAFPLEPLAAAGVPRVFLFCTDTLGRVVAPVWAHRNQAHLVTGATGVTATETCFVAASPSEGDRLEALVELPLDQPLVVTLRPGFAQGGGGTPPAPGHPSGKPPTVLAAGDSTPENMVGESVILPPDLGTLEIGEAERIVAFGRGAFRRETIALVERVAELLGAVVAGSRPAADEGWLPFSRQIGLTGAVVRPKLYLAVGISGAPYHMAGVREPETLVAINADPDAPIFGQAHLAIVGDVDVVLPRLIARLEAGAGLTGQQSHLKEEPE